MEYGARANVGIMSREKRWDYKRVDGRGVFFHQWVVFLPKESFTASDFREKRDPA